MNPETSQLLTELYEREHARIVNDWTIRRRLQHSTTTPEELAADAFAEMAEQIESLAPGENPARRLWQLALRRADQVRYEAGRTLSYGVIGDMHPGASRVLDAQAMIEYEQEPFLNIENAQLPEVFDHSLRELDSDDRDAFILTELRGLTEREAAGLLDTSQPTIHRRAESARKTLRKEIT